MLSVRVQIIVILLLGDAIRGRISVIHAIQHAYCWLLFVSPVQWLVWMIVKPSLTIAQGLEHRAEGPKMTFKSYEDYDGGQVFKDEVTGKVVRSVNHPPLNGLTSVWSGGLYNLIMQAQLISLSALEYYVIYEWAYAQIDTCAVLHKPPALWYNIKHLRGIREVCYTINRI